MNRAWLLLLLFGCSSKERDQALQRLAGSKNAHERAAAVRQLALEKASDDEAWAAIARATRDGAGAVRLEAAHALGTSKRDDAVDAAAPLLKDPADAVRMAGAQAVAAHCGERAVAYLRNAFWRSSAAVRAEVAGGLSKCGVPLEETLRREEADRRARARKQLGATAAAQRAHAAAGLGALGRAEDIDALLPLLKDPDGVVVAAAARGLGEAGAAQAVPQLIGLLKERGEIAAAAIEALAELHALKDARPQLLELSVLPSDEAVPAALAVAPDCAAALRAQNAQAEVALAEDCPAQPFAARPQLDALLVARPAPHDAKIDAAVSRLLKSGVPDVRLPRIAERHSVAGPALVEALKRELKDRATLIAQKPRKPDDEGSAAELSRVPAQGVPNKEKFERLIQRLEERAGHQSLRDTAAQRLAELLRPSGISERRDFLSAALLAARALQAPKFAEVAAGFAQDPDSAIAAAARGERASPPAAPPPPKPGAGDLWSDDAQARSAACSALSGDSSVEALRKALARADPERRVRVACAAANETKPGK